VTAERAEETQQQLRIGRVVVVADDLIWGSRLTALVKSAGAQAIQARNAAELGRQLGSADGVIVDLTARSYDPIAAIENSRAAHRHVLSVGPHEDVELRRRAIAAGAVRVLTYNQVHTHGPTVIGRWLGSEWPNRSE
jgi:DNA-binding NtrC family response regulator